VAQSFDQLLDAVGAPKLERLISANSNDSAGRPKYMINRTFSVEFALSSVKR
jgi:hypothetical protein